MTQRVVVVPDELDHDLVRVRARMDQTASGVMVAGLRLLVYLLEAERRGRRVMLVDPDGSSPEQVWPF